MCFADKKKKRKKNAFCASCMLHTLFAHIHLLGESAKRKEGQGRRLSEPDNNARAARLPAVARARASSGTALPFPTTSPAAFPSSLGGNAACRRFQ